MAIFLSHIFDRRYLARSVSCYNNINLIPTTWQFYRVFCSARSYGRILVLIREGEAHCARASLSFCTDSCRSSSATTTKRKNSRSACSSAPLQLAHYAGISHYTHLSMSTRWALFLITHIITVPFLTECIVDWEF